MNDPQLYVQSNPFQVRDATQVLGVYRKRMSSDDEDVVLDVGCGTGDVTMQILGPAVGRFQMMLGVDKSKLMVDYAQQHYGGDSVHFDVLDIGGDVSYFREDWGTFSKVFSFYCLHWVKNMKKALSNIHYLMKSGGSCLLVFVAQCPVFEMYERLVKISKWQDYMQDVNDFIPITQHLAQPSFVFSQLMEEVGISVVNCSTMNRSFAFTSTKMLTDCMVAVNPFVKRIPEHERNEFVEDCIRILSAIKMEAGNVNENEACCFSYKLLVAHGTKN